MVPNLQRATIAAVCAALIALSAGAVLAEETATQVDAADRVVEKVIVRNEESSAPALSGLMVVRDAETGNLRAPTADEWTKLSASFDPLNRSDAGLVERHHADGRVSVLLEGRFQSMALLHRDAATGETEPLCTHSLEAASVALADGTSTDSSREGVR